MSLDRTLVRRYHDAWPGAHSDEAMLLYDMEVDQLGTLRVAEHFTVAGGKIARARQIHDTAPVRAWAERAASDLHG